MEKNLSRRKFLRILGQSVLAVPACAAFVKTAEAQPTVAVDPNSDKSKQFGYHEDATKVDATKFPKRAGDAGATQFCDNCQLMVKTGLKADGKEGSYGQCSLFPEGLVTEKGWCNMWVAKVGS